jgi:hypothetical protein
VNYVSNSDRDFIVLHIMFGAVVGAALALPADVLPRGWAIFLALVLYNGGLPVYGLYRGYREWFSLWAFAFPLSLWQVFPDWFLSAGLGSLVFPDLGAAYIGTVPVYMALMWTVPVMLLLFFGRRVVAGWSAVKLYVALALLSGLIFGISEATLWMIPIWKAQNVLAYFNAAPYVLLAEFLIGPAAFYAWRRTEGAGAAAKIFAAWIVTLVYTGALAFFYLTVEIILLGGANRAGGL